MRADSSTRAARAVRRYSAGGEVMGSEVAGLHPGVRAPPRMVIFGAIDFSAEMARLASEVGYQVTISDARGAFAESPRFSRVAKVVVDWPDRYLAEPSSAPATPCSSSPTTRSSTSRR